MTRGPVGRRGAAILDLGRFDTGTILAALLVIGLALRIFVAGIYLPLSGFTIDIGDFASWGQRLASAGPASFYQEGYFADYPPGYLYVLWLLGLIGGALGPLVGQDATAGLVKIPGILSDIGGAWLLFALGRRWAPQLLARAGGRIGSSLSADQVGLVAATVYLFNPGVIFNSTVWGQIDSVGTLVVLGTIYLLGRGRTELAAVTATLALLVKFQFAFIVPVVAVVGIKRHLFGRSSDPEHRSARDPVRVLFSLAAGLATLFALMLPFGMTLYLPLEGGDPNGLLGILPQADPTRSLVGKFVEAAGTYEGLSVNALNLWRNPWSGLADVQQWGNDSGIALAAGGVSLSWQQVGTALFAALAVVALWQVARRDDMRGVLIACLLLAVAFFVVPTRVHERYLFPALALAAPLVMRRWTWASVYGALSVVFFANVYWVYTYDWLGNYERLYNPGAHGEPMPRDPVLDAVLFNEAGVYLLSALSVVVLGVIGWRAVVLARRPADETDPMPAAPAPVLTPYHAPEPALAGAEPAPSWRSWLRPDPADPYLREPRRRIDRLDALLLVGLVLFALLFRVWRLDMPRDTHFDEVYHARSATEWMANWEHGWKRDVYEWTHPMVAKYLIAAGIVVADPNKVVAETELGAPVSTLAVVPERESLGRDRSVVFAASGTEVTARDADGGQVVASWDADGPVAALAFDEDGDRLLVGRVDTGQVAIHALADFMAGGGERAPPPEVGSFDSGLEAVQQIVVEPGSSHILLRSQTGVASVERATDEVVATAPVAAAGIARLASVQPGDDDTYDEQPERLVASEPARGVVGFYDVATLEPIMDGDERVEVAVDVPLSGPIAARGGGSDQQVFALTGGLAETIEHPATDGGIAAIRGHTMRLVDVVPLPGSGLSIGWQTVANIVYVGGLEDGAPVVWTINPLFDDRRNGDTRLESSAGVAAFDTTELPGQPLALAFDVSRHAQGDDNGRLLVATADAGGVGGRLVAIDAGSNAFAWRLAGVTFGSILVGLIYLLAATMFSRRRIAVLAAAFVAVDGMSFVMSRISMNDIFVATFIVASYLLFWQIWSGRWRRSAWWVLPLVGVLIGLAAGTKWVGFYALAGLWVLVLARSALGRLVLVGAAAFVAVAGGIGAPWPFALIAAGALGVALLIAYHRPVRIRLDEVLFAVPATVAVLAGVALAFALAYPTVPGGEPDGGVEVLFGLLTRGAQAAWPGLLMLGIGAALLAMRAFVSLRNPRSDVRWAQPGSLGGFGWAWVGACLLVIPLGVYALTYVPYLQLGHVFAADTNIGPGYGWSLEELHGQMFGYHFGLTAGHASASPWWSWPLMLKPTWFQSDSFDGASMAVIYNGGNPILFWAGVPAIVGAGLLAWKRRSPALAMLVIAFAFAFLPWARIERATFAYHYLPAALIAMVAVAYFVDEALRRPQWRDLAIGYLALAALVGLLIFPLGSALPMPDWYISAARALPPWMFEFRFPDPPTGDRGDLLGVGMPQLIGGLVAAGLAGAWAIWGRGLVGGRPGPEPGGGGHGRGVTEPAEG